MILCTYKIILKTIGKMSDKLSSKIEAAKSSGRRLFKKGEINGNGRPRGSKNKVTLEMEAILDKASKGIIDKAIELALQGDNISLKSCLDRLMPARKDRHIYVNVPEIKTLEDTTIVMGDVTNSVTCGEITPLEGQAIANIVEVYRKTIETNELMGRLHEVERQMKESGI